MLRSVDGSLAPQQHILCSAQWMDPGSAATYPVLRSVDGSLAPQQHILCSAQWMVPWLRSSISCAPLSGWFLGSAAAYPVLRSVDGSLAPQQHILCSAQWMVPWLRSSLPCAPLSGWILGSAAAYPVLRSVDGSLAPQQRILCSAQWMARLSCAALQGRAYLPQQVLPQWHFSGGAAVLSLRCTCCLPTYLGWCCPSGGSSAAPIIAVLQQCRHCAVLGVLRAVMDGCVTHWLSIATVPFIWYSGRAAIYLAGDSSRYALCDWPLAGAPFVSACGVLRV